MHDIIEKQAQHDLTQAVKNLKAVQQRLQNTNATSNQKVKKKRQKTKNHAK